MSTRTGVGIVEWGRRASGMVSVHRRVADSLGRFVGDEPDVTVQRALLDRARRHGWCAEEWSTVVPVLHDVDLDAVGPDPSLDAVLATVAGASDGTAARTAESAVAERVCELLDAWTSEAQPVADEPYRLVAARVAHELDGEGTFAV